MIREALEFLFSQADKRARLTKVEMAGREYLFDSTAGKYVEVIPLDCPHKTHAFGTVSALAEYVLRFGNKDRATVKVGPNGIWAYLDEATTYRRDVLTVPFFTADLPPERKLSHEELLLYLDQHAGKIEDEPTIRACLSTVSKIEGQNVTTRDMGASVRLEISATKGVEARNADQQAVPLPKYLTVTLRLGTREYEEPHRFRLQVSTEGKIEFRLLHLDRDGALDRFLTRCVADLRTALGDGWHVYEGVK